MFRLLLQGFILAPTRFILFNNGLLPVSSSSFQCCADNVNLRCSFYNLPLVKPASGSVRIVLFSVHHLLSILRETPVLSFIHHKYFNAVNTTLSFYFIQTTSLFSPSKFGLVTLHFTGSPALLAYPTTILCYCLLLIYVDNQVLCYALS